MLWRGRARPLPDADRQLRTGAAAARARCRLLAGRAPSPPGDVTMWMWTLDAKLINLQAVESIELLEVFPEGTDLEEVDDDALEPDYLELVAMLPSGREALLFESESVEEGQQALEVVAAFVARGGLLDGLPLHEPVSMGLLLERARSAKN